MKARQTRLGGMRSGPNSVKAPRGQDCIKHRPNQMIAKEIPIFAGDRMVRMIHFPKFIPIFILLPNLCGIPLESAMSCREGHRLL